MLNKYALNLRFKQPLALLANSDKQIQDRIMMNARYALRRSDRAVFNQFRFHQVCLTALA
jgi:hypothetical protein